MITIDSNTKVKDIIAVDESLSPILHRHGLDVCCGGNKLFLNTCKEYGISPDVILQEIDSYLQKQNIVKPDLNQKELNELVSYVLKEFHETSREDLGNVEALLPIVVNKHGERFPLLYDLNKAVISLFNEYSQHMMKEERVLFPYILSLVDAKKTNTSPTSQMCGNIEGPINVMRNDHVTIDQILADIKQITNDFTPPEGACNKFRMVYGSLKKFNDDTVRHVECENTILFPKAIELENSVCVNS